MIQVIPHIKWALSTNTILFDKVFNIIKACTSCLSIHLGMTIMLLSMNNAHLSGFIFYFTSIHSREANLKSYILTVRKEDTLKPN